MAATGGQVAQSRVEIEPVDDEDGFWQDGESLLTCLREWPPRIPPWFGYDALGSELFEEITELPNYYLTRAEYALLHRHAGEIAERLDCSQVAELGSGSAKKTRLLLAACTALRPTTYIPVDVAREMLVSSGDALTVELRELRVHGMWGRYEAALARLRTYPDRLAVIFLGSNLGNATTHERAALLAEIAGSLKSGDRFLVSVDLAKPGAVLEAAYNDQLDKSAFARFRLNHLTHLNRRFDGDFELHRFYPRAHYDAASSTVEGHLSVTEDHSAVLRDLGVKLDLRRGDTINVGFSTKFHRAEFVADVSALGFTLDRQWIDAVWQYGLFLFVRQ